MSQAQDLNPSDASVTFSHKLIGGTGRTVVTVESPAGDYVQKLDVTSTSARDEFTALLIGRFPGLDPAIIAGQLERIASEVAKALNSQDGSESGTASDDRAFLLGVATDTRRAQLFHTGQRQDAEAYVTVVVADHHETYAVSGSSFEYWLRGVYFEVHGGAPSSNVLKDVIETIKSIAIFEGQNVPVAVRLAGHGGDIYIDLADDTWRVIRVTKGAWGLIAAKDCPVRFVRSRGMQPLPVPERGGSIDLLRPFVNFPDDDQWNLYAGSLPGLFRPSRAYPIWIFNGEQGSAKSTTCRRTRSLIDPNVAPIRTLPSEEGDLLIAATNSHVLAFDNLSSISQAMSDALCRISTGGGSGGRRLYTNSDEHIMDAVRPILLNGIEDVATKADILDRGLLFTLPAIDERNRKEDALLDARFELVRPRIIGCLLDAVAAALLQYDSVHLRRRPRMLDFARWCTAAESAFGWKPGTFVDLYIKNRGDAVMVAVENSPVAVAILRLMERRKSWTGTPSSLLGVLRKQVERSVQHSREWPKAPHVLTGKVKRLTAPLRSLGLTIEVGMRGSGNKKARYIDLEKLDLDALDPEADAPSAGDGTLQGFTEQPKIAPGEAPEGGADAWNARNASTSTLLPEGVELPGEGGLTPAALPVEAGGGPDAGGCGPKDHPPEQVFGQEAFLASQAFQVPFQGPGSGFERGRFDPAEASPEASAPGMPPSSPQRHPAGSLSLSIGCPDKSERGHTAHPSRPEPPETLTFERSSEVSP